MSTAMEPPAMLGTTTPHTGRYSAATDFLGGLDEDWARIVALIGPCTHDPKAARDPYEALIRAIAYQQLTAKAGDAIIGRLRDLQPEAAFPAPDHVVGASFDDLRACGFSATKVAAVQSIAEGALTGLVPSRRVALEMEDEELIRRIVTIKGVGRWTVQMMLIYTLEREDVLPVDDFGVREGFRAMRADPAAPTPRALHEIGKAWSPHRTVASWYLWRVPRDRGTTMR